MALLLGQGAPSDANIGTNGDYYADTQNRFYYGPKANGTWAGTQVSLTGPTGPGLLYGQGGPAAAIGSIGQGYLDLVSGASWLKNASGWLQVAPSPFQGPQGPVGTVGLSLAGQAYSSGPQAGLSTPTTTTNNQVLPIPGTTIPQTYVLPANAAFAGLLYLNPTNGGGAFSVNLYDQTAGNVVYSTGSISTGSVANLNKLTSPIGLVAGNQHVFRVSAGTNLLGSITPYFLLPATSSVGPSMWPTATISQDTTFTSTQQALRMVGANVAGNGPTLYITPAKASYFQYATITVTGSASVQLVLKTGSTTVFTSATYSASNTPANTPIYGGSDYPLAANANYVWFVQGSGSGQIYLNTSTVG